MPEGDTVFRAARRLDEALAGHEVTRFDIRVPAHATADLTGETVQAVVPRGKHLLMRIGDYTLHSHLKMEGRWLVFYSARPGGLGRVGLCISFPDGKGGWSEPRYLGPDYNAPGDESGDGLRGPRYDI